jgi:phage terminase small subunit
VSSTKARCGAETRSGGVCRAPAGEGGRCPSHRSSDREGLPTPPSGLSAEAVGLWWAVLEDYDLDAHELALLREACRTLSTCDRLAALVDAEGLTAKGSQGQTVAHPAVAEARQQRLTLGRLIAQLRLPEGEDDARPSKATNDGRPQRRGGARGLYAIGGRS